MPKRRLVLIVAIVIAVLGLSAALMSSKSPSKVKIRLLKAEQEGGTVVVVFEITDGTSRQYSLTPVRLEMREDTAWKRCPAAISGFSEPPLGSNMGSRSSFYFPPQSPGSQLRLVVDIQRARQGLDSFWARLMLRLSGQNKQVSLNPFDRTGLIFTKESGDVISEEFTAP